MKGGVLCHQISVVLIFFFAAQKLAVMKTVIFWNVLWDCFVFDS